MLKADLIDRVMEAANLERPVAQRGVGTLLECVGAALEWGDRVVLRGFGVFRAARRKTGVARNPRAGERVDTKAGRVVRWCPAVRLRSFPDTS